MNPLIRLGRSDIVRIAAAALWASAALLVGGCQRTAAPAAAPEPAKAPAAAAGTPIGHAPSARELQAQIAELGARRQAWLSAIGNATDEERARLNAEFFANLGAAIDEMLAVAAAQPESEVGREAALWVVTACDADHPPHRAAAEILLAHHASAAELGAVCGHLQGLHPVYEQLLRASRQKAAASATRGLASLALADVLVQRADFHDVMAATPENHAARVENLGSDVVDFLAAVDRDRDRSEARDLYRRVQQEFAEVPLGTATLGKLAAERLLPFEQSFTQIGEPAPPIDGTDLYGKPLRLSDLRGKVVVVVFWASWCGPCLARVPEENALLAELENHPFALVGVSSDQQAVDAQAAADKHGMAFRSWWDDPTAGATIAARWRVAEWPTTFVIDPEGVIRHRGLHGPELRQAVLRLLGDRVSKM